MSNSGMRTRVSGRRRRRVRIHPRFYVFLVLLVGTIVLGIIGVKALVSSISGPAEVVVTLGMLEDTQRFNALLLRDEEVVKVNTYETVIYTASENQNVISGDDVLDVYERGYSEERLRELELVREEIRKLQEQANPFGDLIDEDLIAFETYITAKSNEIQSFTRSAQGGKLVELERDLRTLMTQRQEYIRRTQSSFNDSELQAKYDEEENLERRIASLRTVYKAARDGRVSFSSDGMEYFLNMDSLANITVADVQNMIKGTLPSSLPPEVKASETLFRIVNPNKWYALIVAKEKDWMFAVGQSCEMYFAGYDDLPFVAQVRSIIADEQENVLITLEMSEDIGPLINARSVTASIGGRIEGMVVPLTALKEKDGKRGVYLTDGQTFVEVNVLGRDSQDALVMPVNESELSNGMKVLRK